MHATTFAESAALVGIPIEQDADSIVVQITETDRKHKRLSSVSAVSVMDRSDVYFAAGGFVPGSVSISKGRTKGNLKRVHVIPLDCDLADFIGAAKDDVYAMPQSEIDALIPAMVQEAYFAAQAVGLPITVITYTGHGIQIVTQLTGEGTDRIADIDAALKVLIKRMNTASPGMLDRQASDAGTRLFRAPGSLNTKCVPYGQPARRVRVLEAPGEVLTVDRLLEIAQIDHKPAPARITPAHAKELPPGDVEQIVAALQPHWTLGQKHAMSLAVSGMLAKAGVPEPQALAIVGQLSAGDSQPWDRAKSVASSYARYRAGADVRGYFALRDFAPIDAADFVDGILERFRQSNAPRIVVSPGKGGGPSIEETFTRKFERTIAPVPESAFYGWFGEYRELMKNTTAAPDQFHLGASFVLTSALTNRRVVHSYNSEALFTNVFIALIGRTGTTYKDTAMKRALEQFPHHCPPNRAIRPNYQFLRDISSQQGLIKNLGEKTNAVLKMSELTTMLRNAKRKGTETIIDALITAWDGGVLENNSKGEPATADSYQLNVIAATQPGRLANEMTSEEIESGFANRWIYIFGSGKPPIAITEEIDHYEAGRLYLELYDRINAYHEGTVLALSGRAKSLWVDWFNKDQESIQKDADEDRADMRARHANLIRKLSLIYAISDGASEIDDRHMQPAIDFVSWMWGEVQAVMRSWGASMDIKLEERIREVLTGGPLARRDLQRRIGGNKFSARDFAITLEAMAKNRTVEIDASGLVVLS